MSKLRAVLPSTTKRRHDFISCLSSQTNLSSHDFPFDVDVTVRHLEAERNVGQICQFVRLLVDEVPSRAYNAAQRCSKTRPFKPFRLSILSNSHFDFEILDRCQIQMRLVSRQGETGFWPTLAALPDSFACLTAWTTQPHNPSQNGSGLHLLNQLNIIKPHLFSHWQTCCPCETCLPTYSAISGTEAYRGTKRPRDWDRVRDVRVSCESSSFFKEVQRT